MTDIDSRLTGHAAAEFPGFDALPSIGGAASIATADGAVPAGWLRAGDLVVTRDRGLQPVLAVGVVRLGKRAYRDTLGAWQISLAADALGAPGGAAPLVVSPWQRLLVRGPELQLMLGLTEALVPARHLIGRAGVECDMPDGEMIGYQIVLRHHELLLADGQWTESLFLDPETLAGLRTRQPGALAQLGEGHSWTVRPELRDWEAALILPPARRADDREEPARQIA